MYESESTQAIGDLRKWSNAKSISYEDFVNKFARRQAFYVFMMVLGVFTLLGAVLHSREDMLLYMAGIGAGLMAAGAAGFLFNWQAHDAYLNNGLGVTTTETWTAPRSPAPVVGTRPFVPSSNGENRPTSTRTGRLNFLPGVWHDLFHQALLNDGMFTRDGARMARVGREYYHGEGWHRLKAELEALRFMDEQQRMTRLALTWYEATIPLPLRPDLVRAHKERTNDERTTNERRRPTSPADLE